MADVTVTPAYSSYKTIKVGIDSNGVAIIMFDRPKELNAVGSIDLNEVRNAIERLQTDDSCKVIILTGSGRAFSAGATLTDPNSRYGVRINPPVSELEHRDPGGPLAFALENSKKVTIAAVQGVAVGIGATMICAMDIRVSYKENRIGFVFNRRGIVPESMSTYFVPKLIGMSRALALFLTGAILPCSHPTLQPLFHELVDKPDQVLPKTVALATDIAKNCSVPANAAIKALVRNGADSSEEQHVLDSRALHALVVGNPIDVNEGTVSFLEKRDAVFKGTVKDIPSFIPWWKSKI
ncbi:hypothetical protein SmJEL517_g01945 [Synchytrium microbalum]|uniref:Enoyl-CoA hydratase n=1 Tax=Synchytrium microbalum TaxID=1806994 RepID=A0A507C2C3_9FUNG|nr:uncharacterized protein SmJEL517_g01945 [Synchytrium microbalum]TPX35660.1 hypothetical protein SmJEL517_g01945 [Synchytrium microbalum]